jgi:hypothetical protein
MPVQQSNPPLRDLPGMIGVLEKTILAVQPFGFLADTVMQPLSQLRDDMKAELDAAKVTTGTATPTPAPTVTEPRPAPVPGPAKVG